MQAVNLLKSELKRKGGDLRSTCRKAGDYWNQLEKGKRRYQAILREVFSGVYVGVFKRIKYNRFALELVK